MKTAISRQKMSSLLILTLSFTSIALSPTLVLAREQNKVLSYELLGSLKRKVDGSITNARGVPLLPADNQRLAIQCLDDEFQFKQIENGLIKRITDSFYNKQFDKLNSITTLDFKSNSLSSSRIISSKEVDFIKLESLAPGKTDLNTNEAKNDFKSYVGYFKNINFVEFVTTKVVSLPESRLNQQLMKDATLFVNFSIRGSTAKLSKVEQRGKLKLLVTNSSNGWKLKKLEVINHERLATNAVLFKNITASLGADKLVPSHLRREAIRRGGYALAISNNDSSRNSNMLVATVAETVLIKNKNGSILEKISNPELEKQTLVKGAAFADFNNSGEQDLLMVRFAPNESQSELDRSDIQIFKSNDKGQFAKRNKVINFNKETAYAMPLAIADFDNDSYLDFYIGFPGSKDFTTLESPIHKKNLTTEGVFYNQKNGAFKEDAYKVFEKRHTNIDDLSRIFPHGALAADFNNDRKMDLIVIDDRGNLSPIYENLGNGNFKSASEKIGVGLKDYGMGVDLADFNNDGKFDFVMSAVNFNASKRLKESCSANWSVEDVFMAGTSGLRVFQANNNSSFVETTQSLGLDYVGEGSGGVKVIDYNNDGFQDIYLTTGLWSGSEKDSSQDLSSYFVAASSLGILEDNLKSELNNQKFIYDKIKVNNDFKSLLFNSESQSSVMDLLSFYRGDLNVNGTTAAKKSLSLAGNQPNRMFRNNGDGTFTEVGYMIGVDSMADGYMAATASFENDGKIDLVLRNADPGYSVTQFPAMEIYKNVSPLKNNSLTLELKGNGSNRDAIGAFVEATVNGKAQVSQLVANYGTVQSQRIIHFGLGKNKSVDKLKIVWPSGSVQNFYNLKSGFHKIEESGKLLSLK